MSNSTTRLRVGAEYSSRVRGFVLVFDINVAFFLWSVGCGGNSAFEKPGAVCRGAQWLDRSNSTPVVIRAGYGNILIKKGGR
jgi:hypothetical protein